MNDSVRFGRILGIPIGVNWSILAIAVLFTVTLAVQGLPRSAPDASLRLRLIVAAVAVAAFLASILAHELGHAIVALGHGVGVDGITLWLLGGLARLDRPSPTAAAEFRIAVAGPAVSALLGVFFAATTIVALGVAPARLLVASLAWLAGINLLLAVFNLLPAAPLDGGRVLTAWLWHRGGDAERARIIAGRCGLVLSVSLIVGGATQALWFGRFEGWLTVLVGAFTLSAARTEIVTAVVRRRLATTTVAELAVANPPPIPDGATVAELDARSADPGAATVFPVVRWTTEPIGWAVTAHGGAMGPAERSWTPVRAIMRPPEAATIVDGATAIDELLEHWERRSDQIAVVLGADGSVRAAMTGRQIEPLLTKPDFWGRDRVVEPAGPAPTPVP